jgi:hypothetical protein
VKTSASRDSSSFPSVLDLDLISAFPILISLGWSMFIAGSADEFALYGLLHL